jgi:hypothetical protein
MNKCYFCDEIKELIKINTIQCTHCKKIIINQNHDICGLCYLNICCEYETIDKQLLCTQCLNKRFEKFRIMKIK